MQRNWNSLLALSTPLPGQPDMDQATYEPALSPEARQELADLMDGYQSAMSEPVTTNRYLGRTGVRYY